MILVLFLVKAFHIKFDELKVDKNIQQWDIQVLQVSWFVVS